ncbi:hypothetical protein [Sphingomonas sp. So64.6b]|uniref:mannitol dehydrogenase family protein n=1 Tax=Sphingomonas sp. So64.6b TaxID=2997354 RepID=UPI001FCEDE40|nr:hypothetical protein [Sphingomonas sp. So64.6b]
MTETFSQWVIEDSFAGERPRWEVGGAQIVADVRPFETAKLRILNGAHSALAYLGLAKGHQFVHQAVADPAIRPLIEQLMRGEAAASLAITAGQDVDRYVDALLARFANAALPHRLIQIAADGSQKIGPRWLEAIVANRAQGREAPATLTALAAWIAFVKGDRGEVNDPLAEALADAWRGASPERIVMTLFGPRGMFGTQWQLDSAQRDLVARAVAERISI